VRHGGTFTPHLTVTHFPLSGLGANRPFGPRDERDELCEEIRADQQRAWRPLRFPVREIHVLSRDGPEGQFRCRARIPLGGGGGADGAAAVEDSRYALMPEALPAFCVDRRKARPARRSRSAPQAGGGGGDLDGLVQRARSTAAAWARGAAGDADVEGGVEALGAVCGTAAARGVVAWLAAGGDSDAGGYLLPPMEDRTARAAGASWNGLCTARSYARRCRRARDVRDL
jgi:hypothetical protein